MENSKSEITKGPWAWRRFGDTYTLHAEHGRRDTILGAIPHGEMKYPVVAMSIDGRLTDIDPEHPNAKLIAAAPDLLNAISSIMIALNKSSCGWNMDSDIEGAYQLLGRAYKKATE